MRSFGLIIYNFGPDLSVSSLFISIKVPGLDYSSCNLDLGLGLEIWCCLHQFCSCFMQILAFLRFALQTDVAFELLGKQLRRMSASA